ncbi:fungal-specific transcription factor domain-containing protein [Xylariomycetidae sp. FL0641]|nr:fungal-specific transcription factor domain-containing protein [Xylariomycetidae sp. FL0641]
MGEPIRNKPARLASSRLARSTNACSRCRRRKQRCDLGLPKCSACEAAGVPCLTYDGEKQTEVPRGYTSALEAEVRQLRAALDDLQRRQEAASAAMPGPAFGSSSSSSGSPAERPERPERAPEAATPQTVASDPQDVVRSMGLVMLESSTQPRFMGTSSGITFAKMVLAAVKGTMPVVAAAAAAAAVSPTQGPPGGPLSQAAAPASPASSLPLRHTSRYLVDVYFRHRIPCVHVLARSQVRQVFDRVYHASETAGPGPAEQDLFIAYMVLAVSLCSLPVAGGAKLQQSEGYFNSALRCADPVFRYSTGDLETLTSILLLAQYVALNPARGSLWQLTGMALRLCIDLGLHWETDAVLTMPWAHLNERRRLFWATYRFDRLLCITLGRPFGIADQSINAAYPGPPAMPAGDGDGAGAAAEYHDQLVANHIAHLYRLESEVKHVLYHQLQGATLAYPRADYGLWLQDIQPRLEAWRENIPPPAAADPDSIYAMQSWWDAVWCDAVLLLHRPNPLVPQPPLDSLRTCFHTACVEVQAIKVLQRDGRVCVVWQWVHHLFLAGLTMIYCIWHSREIRAAARILDLMTAVQDCASTLTALAERFPDAHGCRDVFESLSAATMRWIMAVEQGDAAADDESHYPLPNIEINHLRQQIPFSTAGWRAHEPTSIFPDEPFEFAEYLIAASQFPGPNCEVGNAFNVPNIFDAGGMEMAPEHTWPS